MSTMPRLSRCQSPPAINHPRDLAPKAMAKINRGLGQRADSSRPPKESLLQSSTRTLASQAAQCSPTVPFPLNSLWGTGTARSLGFSRGNRLRSFDHIGSSRSAKSPARGHPAVAESGPFSDVSVDLHGVKAPGETTRSLDQNLRRRILCGKVLVIARC